MNLILVGYGKMGRLIAETISAAEDMRLLGIVDVDQSRSFDEIEGVADVVIDFSYPGNLGLTLDYVEKAGAALVMGTTGLSDDQIERLRAAAAKAAVMFSYNYSLGVAVLRRALEMAAPALEGFDVEIVEAHHRQKADAPSGTAKLLLAAVDPGRAMRAVDGRSGITGARERSEIGMHAIRGGTLAGEHSVLFLGDQETLEFRHSAQSRQIFVNGAMRAARFVYGRAPGLYSVDDMLWGDKE